MKMKLTNGEIKAEAEGKNGVANGNLEEEIVQTRFSNENHTKSVNFSPNEDIKEQYSLPVILNNNTNNENNDQQEGDQEHGFCELEMEEKINVQVQDNQDSKTEISDFSTKNHVEKDENNSTIAVTPPKINGYVQIIQPDSHLPKPEAPPGLSLSPKPQPILNGDVVTRSTSSPDSFGAVDMPSIGKFIRDRSSSLSASISKRFSSLKFDGDHEDDYTNNKVNSVDSGVTEFNISGLKVVVKLISDEEDEQFKGQISFFSRSNCRDCTAVRSFFRERGFKFVEINIDVYPQREKELIERTGSSQVPQIFFNEKLFGGLVALNSLRNSGGFDQRMKEMLARKCSADAPAPPVYGFDDPDEEESADEMVAIAKVLRQRLPIQDRLMKMKIVKNCFGGNEMVEVLIHHFDCGRKKAVEIGKQLARKHFIHHVFGENDFEDGNHYYRFLEHEPFIPKCYNFRGSINDSEPKPAFAVGQRLNKIMSAILESYASDDRCHVDYAGISKSEEFRRYVNLTQDLQRVNLLKLTSDEKLAFFLNLYNATVIHAIIRVGCPEGVIDRRSFYSDFQYIVGGSPYSLNTMKNGILRSNRRSPYSLVKPLGTADKRLEVALPKGNPLIHFGLCNGTKSSPTVKFFTPQGIEAELRRAAREFFQRSAMEVNLEKRTVYLTRIFKWFNSDFGQEKEILRWIINYLDATKAGLLAHLLGDGGPVNIVYQDYDWSLNSQLPLP